MTAKQVRKSKKTLDKVLVRVEAEQKVKYCIQTYISKEDFDKYEAICVALDEGVIDEYDAEDKFIEIVERYINPSTDITDCNPMEDIYITKVDNEEK